MEVSLLTAIIITCLVADVVIAYKMYRLKTRLDFVSDVNKNTSLSVSKLLDIVKNEGVGETSSKSKLEQYIEENNIHDKDLADDLGISHSAVIQIKRTGIKRKSTATEYANVLNCEPSAILESN